MYSALSYTARRCTQLKAIAVFVWCGVVVSLLGDLVDEISYWNTEVFWVVMLCCWVIVS
jgi:hypothetical protein